VGGRQRARPQARLGQGRVAEAAPRNDPAGAAKGASRSISRSSVASVLGAPELAPGTHSNGLRLADFGA
jgi:hypothetical protein